MLKKIFRSALVMNALAWLAAKYISFVFNTSKWTYVGRENIMPFWREGKPIITCFWHGRMLMMPCAWMSESPFSMLISGHPDGQIIAKTISHHGIGTIVGSKSKGGLEALRSIVSQLKKGVTVGITPDGPRGPRCKASEGIVTISKLSQVPIMPCTFATSRSITVNSWDRFKIPLPFSRAVMMWHKPLPAPAKTATKQDLEKLRQDVEDALNLVSSQAVQTCKKRVA